MQRVTRFGTFELAGSGELRKSGMRLRLSGKPIEVLLVLVERPGEVVTREELQKRLWPDGTWVDFDHGLNNAINRLRQALGDSAETPRFIETIPRRGYRFIGALIPEETPRVSRRWLAATAATLLAVLGVVLTLAAHRQRASSRAAAQEAYSKGRQELTLTRAETVARSRAYFERAIALDSRYAPAHAGLAMALNRAGDSGFGEPRALHGQAMRAAERALELDPSLADAYVARARARLRLRWDWTGADSDLRRAIEIDPEFVKARQTYAFLLAARGRASDALQQIDTARHLDSLSLEVQRDRGVILYLARRYDDAIAELRTVMDRGPQDADTYRILAECYQQTGNRTAAADEYARFLEHVNVNAAEVAEVRTLLQQEGFEALWRRLTTRGVKPGHSYKSARTLAALGRSEEALSALETAFRAEDSQLLYLAVDPYLDPLRSDQRFTTLLSRAKL